MLVQRTWQFRQLDANKLPVKPLKIYIVRAEYDPDQDTPTAALALYKQDLATKLGVHSSQIEFLSGTNGWSELVRV